MKRIPLLVGFLLFIALCLSGTYWVMRLIQPEVRKVNVPLKPVPVADVGSVAGLFGGAILVDTNYQLKGVVQANPMNQSVAVIAIDGKPTEAYLMDTEVNSGATLSEVSERYVLLMDNGIVKRVELPMDAAYAQITEVPRAPASNQSSGMPANKNKNTSNKNKNREIPLGQSQGMKIPPSPPPINRNN